MADSNKSNTLSALPVVKEVFLEATEVVIAEERQKEEI